MQALEGIKGKA